MLTINICSYYEIYLFITVKTRTRLFQPSQSQYWIYSNILTWFHSIKKENLDVRKQFQMVVWKKKFPCSLRIWSINNSQLKVKPKLVTNYISAFLKKHLNLTNSTRITLHITLYKHVMGSLVNELSTILLWWEHENQQTFLTLCYTWAILQFYVEQACKDLSFLFKSCNI